MFQSEKKWDDQWSKGQWAYMDKVPIERCKIALIGELSKMYSSFNSSAKPYVLDIGCGEGSLADFLREDQKRFYTGIDVSKQAVLSARQKRPDLRFIHAPAHKFVPRRLNARFSLITMADMLYYVDYKMVLNKYRDLLMDDGIMIISMFQKKDKVIYENIWQYAREILDKVDEMELLGTTKKKAHGAREVVDTTVFHIEVYRKKSAVA